MKNIQTTIRNILLTLSSFALSTQAYAAVRIEDVFKKYRINNNSEYSELNNVANLPDPDAADIIIQIINLLIRITGILTFIAFTVAGMMFVLSRGEGDTNMQERAKKTLTYAVIGVIFIMSAYAIVYGITALEY